MTIEEFDAMPEAARIEYVQRQYSLRRDRKIREKIERREAEYQRLILDIDMLKFHYKYRWIPMIISIASLVLSMVAMVFSFLSYFFK